MSIFIARVETDLDSLAHIVRTDSRDQRIPVLTQKRVQRVVNGLLEGLPASIAGSYSVQRAYHDLRRASSTQRAPLIYNSIRRFRDAVRLASASDITRHETLSYPATDRSELMVAHTRISQLETELGQLRKERPVGGADENEDEFENMVKKFNDSKNRVFVIMPFNDEFDDVWVGGIKKACLGDFAPLRVDQISLSSWITDDVEEYIDKSTTVVADVTGNNPNVMFELGYALGRKKDPIIIVQPQEPGKVPFDISGIRHLEYADSWQGIEALAKNLRKFLTATSEKQKTKGSKSKA